MRSVISRCLLTFTLLLSCGSRLVAQTEVAAQPLAANLNRLSEAMEFLGTPLPVAVVRDIREAEELGDAAALQAAIDDHVLLLVAINPELRVKVSRGPAKAEIQQGGFTPFLIKVLNEGTTTRKLDILSPQAGRAYAGESEFTLQRQEQTELASRQKSADDSQFLDLEMFNFPPMTASLSGLEVEYVIGLAQADRPGKREATIGFDLGGGNQDLGFRGQTPVLFDVRPALPVRVRVADHDGGPTVARLTFRDARGRVYPPQARRVAPDFFFQPHVYRPDGGTVLLPPGDYQLTSTRGPEYLVEQSDVTIRENDAEVAVRLRRWVDPAAHGYYSGDHHIHGAGCSHYTSPTQGVTPEDMFLQVKGEGLNVGCVLTWGPCFDFQRQYFAPVAKTISEPMTVLKYDLEISGFGSAALGHVCLLNLTDQTYPGSDGTSTKGWPSWTVPVMRWTKQQGGYTGYPHSAMYCVPENAARRLLAKLDTNNDQQLDEIEAASGLLPRAFGSMDRNRSRTLDRAELTAAHEHAIEQIPNLAVPDMDGAGAMEIFVSAAEGVCDFISAMDTARIPEWNTWYHLMNCGLPIRLSGETDFPCMSSRRVGMGRVYVKLGETERIDFPTWCAGLASGRSYVSDGYLHAFDYQVGSTQQSAEPGGEPLRLPASGQITASATVQIAPATPEAVAHGTQNPPNGRARTGDTVNLHQPRSERMIQGGTRRIELIVNGRVVAHRDVPADGKPHAVRFQTRIESSSWVAIRQFPQLHTNPVDVIVADKPIRASRASALWCIECVELLWKNRKRFIREPERAAARAAYDRAIEKYRAIAAEAPEGT